MMTSGSASLETARHHAVRALTAVATREDREAAEGFSDDLSKILTSVAANLGGTEKMVSGERAEHISGLLLESSIEALAPYRTEPVRISIHPGDTLGAMGWEELYCASQRALHGLDGRTQPLPLESVGAALRELQELRSQDELEWFDAFSHTATEIARSLGVTTAVEVVRRDDDAELSLGDSDELENLVTERAICATPLPGSGKSFDDYQGYPVAVAEEQAGRMPHQRLLARD